MTAKQEQKSALVVLDLVTLAQFLGKRVFRTVDDATFDAVVSRNDLLISAFAVKELPAFIVNLELTGLLRGLNPRLSRPLLSDEALAAGTMIAKHGPSGFEKSDLQARGVEKLYVTGFSTDNAVKKTIADAEALGYQAIAVSDAALARNSATQERQIREFHEVISAKGLLRALE
ncbi:hypothetical protein AYR62_01260 [Secundilactobacillus paracollinoides]|uniref:isochorismatase family protein n=1 Tax=Secundilactobacillus paracollinoides TaxID=240427 RepID=UPI00081A93FB|nr:isochorismatase family protein [Secundilactobacillus paracollinoides]ANZ62863.1 hypothetical protein AYR62_01260 [Secundilactobacillus paracollinoides]